MVNPVTKSPVVYKTLGSPVITYYEYREGYRQKTPFDLSLTYNSRHGRTLYANGYTMAANLQICSTTSAPIASTKNRAYDDFKGNLRAEASIGAAVAEASKSYGMVAQRARQLFDFSKAVKSGQFLKAAKILKQSTIPKGVSAHKAFAANYLEYHYGWRPMVQDIYDACDVIQSPIKESHPTGKASTGLIIYNPDPTAPAEFSSRTRGLWSGHVRTGATVRITNPNLWLANQLGLVNPASVAWELVPFSFVVDWFVNVEQMLSHCTDFLGVSVTNAYTTTVVKQCANAVWGKPYYWTSGNTMSEMTRVGGVAVPTFASKPYKADNMRRALAQVSLLIQLGLKK